MVNKSIKKNALYNVARRTMAVIFPLITYPYATRILGVENIGKVNYIASIVNYFTLLASFGATTYGTREGAIYRDDKNEFSLFTSKVFSINILFTVISYGILFILSNTLPQLSSYKLLIVLESIIIASTALAADWINVVYEDYKYITYRSFVIYIVTLIVLFVFVKDADDYYIYASMTVISNAMICILNLLYCRKYAKIRLNNPIHDLARIKKMSVFFANELTVSIYVNIDTTMVGLMKGDKPVGIYSVSVKIYTIVKTIFAAIYSVALSRLSYYFHNKNYKSYKVLLSNIISALVLLLIPGAVGLCVLSPAIVRVIAGDKFSSSTLSLRILCVALIFAIFGGVVTNCINLPMNLEKVNLHATVISALTNIILNIPFIYLLSERGAAITTAISEFVVFVYCIIRNKEGLKFIIKKQVLRNLLDGVVGGVIIILLYCFISRIKIYALVQIGVMLFSSVLVYGLYLILVDNKIFKSLIKRRR